MDTGDESVSPRLRDHLAAFLNADNFARRLKTLRGLTPYEATCRACSDDPSRFRYDPTHLTVRLTTKYHSPTDR